MKLMTKAIEKKIPALYATEGISEPNKRAFVKFFNPMGSATWYGVEYDPDERIFAAVPERRVPNVMSKRERAIERGDRLIVTAGSHESKTLAPPQDRVVGGAFKSLIIADDCPVVVP